MFFPHFVELPAKNQLLLDYFETLAAIEKGCKERQLKSACEICFVIKHMRRLFELRTRRRLRAV